MSDRDLDSYSLSEVRDAFVSGCECEQKYRNSINSGKAFEKWMEYKRAIAKNGKREFIKQKMVRIK